MKNISAFRIGIWTLALGLGLSCSGTVLPSAAAAAESDLSLSVQSFTWKEFVGDKQEVKESGTLYGIGYAYEREFDSHVTFKPAAEFFFGPVDYNGHTMSGESATTTVDYWGARLEGDLGRRYRPAEAFSLEPFAGLGLRAWLRDIKNGTTASGSGVSGYTEQWITLQARLGIRTGVDFSSASAWFAEAGVKLPLYNQNTAYLSNAGLGPDVTLYPGKQSSLFAETGLKIDRFRASLFYDGLRFSASDPSAGYYQPKSTEDIYGIRAGFVF